MNIWLESFVCFMVFPVNSNFVGKFFLLMVYSESLSNPNFHWVLNRAQHHMDMLTTDKKNLVLWGKRLHIAIQVSLIFFLLLCVKNVSTTYGFMEFGRVASGILFISRSFVRIYPSLSFTHTYSSYTIFFLPASNSFTPIFLFHFCALSTLIARIGLERALFEFNCTTKYAG